jgi:predicted nucleic acid-binding protein
MELFLEDRNKVLRVYLDSCALSRPFDEYLNQEIALEARAVEMILQLVETGEFELVDSEILEAETKAMNDPEKKSDVKLLRERAKYYVNITTEIIARASELMKHGIKDLDAFHLACAESKADVFITVDKRFLKKALQVPNLKIKVFNPIDFWRYYVGSGN